MEYKKYLKLPRNPEFRVGVPEDLSLREVVVGGGGWETQKQFGKIIDKLDGFKSRYI